MKSASCCKRPFWSLLATVGFLSIGGVPCVGQSNATGSAGSAPKSKIIIDTDIGDDVDDAFALGLALNSPEVEIVGITTAWGDTRLRARLVDRLLTETGHTAIPVAEGIHRQTKSPLTHAGWD